MKNKCKKKTLPKKTAAPLGATKYQKVAGHNALKLLLNLVEKHRESKVILNSCQLFVGLFVC